MSLPIAPRPTSDGSEHHSSISPSPIVSKARKISTACGACKQRKTKCSGGQPCEACAARNSICDYDATSDQRRKIANQRNVQELAHAQHDLERYRQLLGGVLAIFKAGSPQSTADLLHLVRNGTDLSSLGAYVRNEIRSTLNLQRAFEAIDFQIDGPTDLPSPSELLNRIEAFGSNTGSVSDSGSGKYSSNYSHMDGHTDNSRDGHMESSMDDYADSHPEGHIDSHMSNIR